MATYSAALLEGKGAPMEAINSSDTKTFTLTAPSSLSGSAYFTIETVRNNDGFYDSSSPSNAIGVYSSLTDVQTLVTSSYIASVVVEQGGGSFQFSPTSNITVSESMVRATGGLSLQIS